MDREQALKHFSEQYVIPARRHFINEVLNDFSENREQWGETLAAAFASLCEKIVHMQEFEEKEEIAYINLSLLRSSLVEKKLVIQMEAYNREWYVDENECFIHYEAEWLYQYVEQFQNKLAKNFRQYVLKIFDFDIDSIMQQELEYFIPFVVDLFRYLLQKRIISDESFQQINLFKEIYLYVGEYLEPTEQVYYQNFIKTDDDKLQKRVEVQHHTNFSYEDLRKQDLANVKFVECEFQYSDLSGSNLEECQFDSSTCVGVNFSKCNLQNASFAEAYIQDADFQESDCRGANFRSAFGDQMFLEEDAYIPCSVGLNFDHANLEGADFQDAQIEKASFKEAKLTNATFSADLKGKLDLAEEQIKVINWV